jgi:hypothetical protein
LKEARMLKKSAMKKRSGTSSTRASALSAAATAGA